jgi:hypothetical protein
MHSRQRRSLITGIAMVAAVAAVSSVGGVSALQDTPPRDGTDAKSAAPAASPSPTGAAAREFYGTLRSAKRAPSLKPATTDEVASRLPKTSVAALERTASKPAPTGRSITSASRGVYMGLKLPKAPGLFNPARLATWCDIMPGGGFGIAFGTIYGTICYARQATIDTGSGNSVYASGFYHFELDRFLPDTIPNTTTYRGLYKHRSLIARTSGTIVPYFVDSWSWSN